jgi:hypothetical protein
MNFEDSVSSSEDVFRLYLKLGESCKTLVNFISQHGKKNSTIQRHTSPIVLTGVEELKKKFTQRSYIKLFNDLPRTDDITCAYP